MKANRGSADFADECWGAHAPSRVVSGASPGIPHPKVLFGEGAEKCMRGACAPHADIFDHNCDLTICTVSADVRTGTISNSIKSLQFSIQRSKRVTFSVCIN